MVSGRMTEPIEMDGVIYRKVLAPSRMKSSQRNRDEMVSIEEVRIELQVVKDSHLSHYGEGPEFAIQAITSRLGVVRGKDHFQTFYFKNYSGGK